MILIGGEKGGTGKTTLATNLAALRAWENRDVLLIDTDVQGSASAWAASRDERGGKVPRVGCVQKFGKALQGEAADLAGRYNDIIIDAGGRDSAELRAALVVANKAFIPIQPSQFDIWTLDRMDNLVQSALPYNPSLQALVVICRASTNPVVGESAEARSAVQDFESLRLAESVIRDRIAFRRSVRDGLCVAELTPVDEKAKDELYCLYREVFHDGQQAQAEQQTAV